MKHCFNMGLTFERKLFTGKSDMSGVQVPDAEKAVSGRKIGLYVYATFIAHQARIMPTMLTYSMPKVETYCMPAPRRQLSNIVP